MTSPERSLPWPNGKRVPYRGSDPKKAVQARCVPEPNSGCHLWLGSLDRDGYGRVRCAGAEYRPAHRLAYEAENGPVPKGLVLDHKCRVRCCVNPSHLEPVTNRENILRGESRAARSSRQTHCKNGHPLSGDNVYTYLKKPTIRRCRACINLNSATARRKARLRCDPLPTPHRAEGA